MNTLYQFPNAAALGRTLSKSKIYEHATPTSKVRELFVTQVEKITWAYKLSSSTINLPASESVKEIQVFDLALRTETLSPEVLQAIDKAIPSPILFVLSYNDKRRYASAYKRHNNENQSKWTISSYFESDWVSDLQDKVELPVVLNMSSLYYHFLKKLIPLSSRKGEALDELVHRFENLKTKERELAKLKSQISREKQFNRRVELNRTLNTLMQETQHLMS